MTAEKGKGSIRRKRRSEKRKSQQQRKVIVETVKGESALDINCPTTVDAVILK